MPAIPARELRTTAEVTLAAAGGGFDITRIALRTVGEVPGVDQAVFADLARRRKLHGFPRAGGHRDHT